MFSAPSSLTKSSPSKSYRIPSYRILSYRVLSYRLSLNWKYWRILVVHTHWQYIVMIFVMIFVHAYAAAKSHTERI